LVAKLCDGQPHSISQLTEGSRLTRQAITKHLHALANAGLREGKKIGRWEVAAPIAAQTASLDTAKLLARAQSPDVAARAKASTDEFSALQVNQRPTFLLENSIGDRALFSGLARLNALAVALDEILADEAAYASWKSHFGDPPAS